MSAPRSPQRSLRTFGLLLIGQAVSTVGTQLTAFALGVTVFQRTGSVTQYSTVILASMLPGILAAPIAGMLTDRWDRRLSLLTGHAGAGLCMLGMLVAYRMGALGLQIILPMLAIKALFESFMGPAFNACVVALVPKEQFDRANGLTQLSVGVGQVAAPTLAGFLLPAIGLGNIFLIDVATFIYATVVLLFLRVPRIDSPRMAGSSLLEAAAGLDYLRGTPGLVALIAFGAFSTFFLGMVQDLFSPLVLAFGNAPELGLVDSIGGVGFIVGSVAISIWGAPRRRVRGLLVFTGLQGTVMLIAVAKPSVVLAGIGSFGVLLTLPFTMACSQGIWQTSVPLALQGRVSSVRNVVSSASFALATVLAGPLTDRVFEPLMASGGGLASALGPLLGVGPGRGVALLMALFGTLLIATVSLARRHRPLLALDAGTSHSKADAPPGTPLVAQP